MGKHPIRCGFMCPPESPLPLVKWRTQPRPNIKGETGFVAILGKTAKIHPKVVNRKIVSPYHIRNEPRVFAWMQTKALLPFCNKGWGSQHNRNIFDTSILGAHYIWEKVHILAMLGSKYLWVLEEHKYE